MDYNEKFCFECQHFNMCFGTPDWSEVTPGDLPHISCGMAVWSNLLDYNYTRQKFAKSIRMARECEYYTPEEG